MRCFSVALLLAGCAASPKAESTTLDYCWPVFGTTHEMAWGAAQTAAAWTRTVDEVDTANWTIRCSGGTTWQVTPRRDPNDLLWVNLTIALPPILPYEQSVSSARFLQALDLIKHGSPLPAEAPSVEGTRYGFASVYPGKSTDHRRDGWKG